MEMQQRANRLVVGVADDHVRPRRNVAQFGDAGNRGKAQFVGHVPEGRCKDRDGVAAAAQPQRQVAGEHFRPRAMHEIAHRQQDVQGPA